MMGASIGFYSAFSLAPTLLIVLAITGWFVGRDIAQGQFFGQIRQLLGNEPPVRCRLSSNTRVVRVVVAWRRRSLSCCFSSGLRRRFPA